MLRQLQQQVRLVDLHGGSLEARSGGTGCGAEFLVRLPAGPACERPDAHALPADGACAVEPLRVLVVDDNVDTAQMLGVFVDTLGHKSHVAYDAETALAAAVEFRPQVALLDIGLPGMDGYELAARLQRLMSSVQLVAMTGLGGPEACRRVGEAGFRRHLVKPTDPGVLKEILSAMAGPAPDAPHPKRLPAAGADVPFQSP
jgi:CheY-like chemotaxis protein